MFFLLTIFATHPQACQHIHQNLDITFLNSLILKHASPHAMTQATGSSFFTQAMALATANTTSTALPELIAFMGNRLGQTRANQQLAKVGHLLTLEQQYTLQETYLYGSSRLGVKNQTTTLSTRIASVQNGSLTPIGNAILNTDSVFSGTASAYNLPKAPSSRVFYRTWGLKQYELSNHLGNVQVTISDKKIGITNSGSTDFIAYEPEVKSATDYYAYGMEMPGKTYQSTAYRYGMNTQEKDNEIYGPGNTYGALYWEYDARIARRWNVDPVVVPSLSNYHAFEGNPIMMVDPLGNSAGWYEGKNGVEFDKNINSQEDLDKSGKGKYSGKNIGKKGVGFDESCNQVSLGEDGIKRQGASVIKETTVVASAVNVNSEISIGFSLAPSILPIISASEVAPLLIPPIIMYAS